MHESHSRDAGRICFNPAQIRCEAGLQPCRRASLRPHESAWGISRDQRTRRRSRWKNGSAASSGRSRSAASTARPITALVEAVGVRRIERAADRRPFRQLPGAPEPFALSSLVVHFEERVGPAHESATEAPREVGPLPRVPRRGGRRLEAYVISKDFAGEPIQEGVASASAAPSRRRDQAPRVASDSPTGACKSTRAKRPPSTRALFLSSRGGSDRLTASRRNRSAFMG